jgi:hypothetical protein
MSLNTRPNRCALAPGFIVSALLTLLPILAISGGMAAPAQAEAGPSPPSTERVQQETKEQILVLRVYFADNAERDRLATQIGAEETSTAGGYLTKWADRATYNAMLAAGLRVQIDHEQTRLANVPIQWNKDSANPETFNGGYLTVEEMYAFMDQKVAANPQFAQKIDIGDSWCKRHLGECTEPNASNGYDLFVMRIGNRSPGPKPIFWFDGGIHSREIATPEVAKRFIDYILTNYSYNDPDANWLVNYHEIWVMPILNPDGHHMVESGGNNPTFHRKNADNDDGCTTYDSFGTDINRNFPFVWGCCGGSSGDPCNDAYRGPSANSEEETQALVAKVRSLIPDQRGPNETDMAPLTTTGTLINMHSNARQNLYPWGYTNAHAPNRTDLRNIGRHMSSPNVQPVGNGYEYCQNIECLYVVDGDEKNWAYGELGIPAYSLELAGSGFFPAYPCLDNPPGVNGCTDPDPAIGLGLWPQNKGALLHHAKIARSPYLLTRGPDANIPYSEVTGHSYSTVVVTATINYAWNGSDGQPNNYLQNVAAAEMYLSRPPWDGGGGQLIAMTAVDGAFDSPTEVVRGSYTLPFVLPGTGYTIYVRGRGVDDYEGQKSWGPTSAVFLRIGVAPTPVVTPSPTPTRPSVTPVPSSTSVPTVVPPSSTTVVPSSTTVVPSGTPSPTTGTVVPSSTTVVPSSTTVVPNSTTVVPSGTPSPTTGTVVPSSTTVVPSGTPSPTIGTVVPSSTTVAATGTPAEATVTPGGPTATTTACTINYTDVPPGHTFYPFVRCLACKGIIGGYSDGTFRPNNLITRDQIAKVVSNSAGFNEPPGTQIFEDVPETHHFYEYIQRMARRGIMAGYPCGSNRLEPCVPPGNRPYFRTNTYATRGQISKIVSEAAGFDDNHIMQRYEDVPTTNTFYIWIERLSSRFIMGGYPCGTVGGEPCGTGNRAYFRWGNTSTRGQVSKIVSGAFFPDCDPGQR